VDDDGRFGLVHINMTSPSQFPIDNDSLGIFMRRRKPPTTFTDVYSGIEGETGSVGVSE